MLLFETKFKTGLVFFLCAGALLSCVNHEKQLKSGACSSVYFPSRISTGWSSEPTLKRSTTSYEIPPCVRLVVASNFYLEELKNGYIILTIV